MKAYNSKLKACIFLLLLTSTAAFLSGCWDYREVENRGYVLGIAIDKALPLPQGQDDLKEHLSERDIEKMPPQEGSPKYAYTIQIPIIPQAMIKPTGGPGGGSGGDRTWDLTIAGNSFMEVNRQFNTRLSYPPFYEHMKIIVISEGVARDGITECLDLLLRDHEMRRRTRVFITPGEGKAILDVVPRIDDYSSLYLEKLPLNADKISRIAHKTDLGEVSKSIHGQLDFVLPRVIATEDEIKNAGVAIFKGDKMVGWLGEIDTIYAKWIRDAALGDVISMTSPNNPKEIISLEAHKVSTSVKPIIKNGNIIMKIKTNAVFSIAEEMKETPDNSLSKDYIKEIEMLAKEKIKGEMEDTIKYVQEAYGADIFHFNVALSRYEPKLWDAIKDNWHNMFPDVKTEVEVSVKVRHIGLIK